MEPESIPSINPEEAPDVSGHAPRPLTAQEAKKASYGALISIIIIMAIVIVGAFYAWDKRFAQNKAVQPADQSQEQSY